MPLMHFSLAFLATCVLGPKLAESQQKVVPAPNGTYTVGLITTQVVDEAHLEPFAPYARPRALELSVFYPCNTSQTQEVPYFPPETANLLDVEHSMAGLNTPNGTFERLAMTVAANNSPIATPPTGQWPVLLFSGAYGTTRLFYNAMASHISSTGYVVITIDTPYDTDVVEYDNGTIILLNETVAIQANDPSNATAIAIEDVTARSQDATFILNLLSNTSFTSLIPSCARCLNTSHSGIFGHSIGGATAATALANEPRLVGALNYDGALWGPVVDSGLDKPFMLMITANQTRANQNTTDNPNSSWAKIWNNLRGPKFNMILANSLHYTYSDLPLALNTLGITPSADAMQKEQITDLDGKRALNIIVSYTVAFFDNVLKGEASALLTGPSAEFPEIRFDNSTDGSANGTALSAQHSGAGTMVRAAIVGSHWGVLLVALLSFTVDILSSV